MGFIPPCVLLNVNLLLNPKFGLNLSQNVSINYSQYFIKKFSLETGSTYSQLRRWGNERRKNIHNGYRTRNHKLLQFEVPLTPDEVDQQLNAENGMFFKLHPFRVFLPS